MGKIEKALAIIMLPVAILIVLQATDIFSLNLPIDLVFLGSILMIALQVINLTLLKFQNGHFGNIHIITALVFILPALIYIYTAFFGSIIELPLALIIGIMMIAESLYALH